MVQAACGSCGNDTYKIFKVSEANIITECTKCKAQSSIKPPIPRLLVDIYGESTGGMVFDQAYNDNLIKEKNNG